MSHYFNSLALCVVLIFSAHAVPVDSNAWIEYADNDLRAACVVIDVKDPLVGVALYHIEQAVEKALKAYLLAHNIAFALVHDLKPLLKSCCAQDTDFGQFASDVKEISPYATKSRYPNKSYTPPTKAAVTALIQRAEALVEFVHERI